MKVVGPAKYTTAQVRTILGVSRPNFQVWAANYLPPSTKPTAGQGDAAQWSFVDLIMAKTFQKLIKAGMSRQTAAACVQHVPADWVFSKIAPSEVRSIWFQFYFNEPDKLVMRLVRDPALKNEHPIGEFEDYSLMIGVNLVAVEAELKEAIAKL